MLYIHLNNGRTVAVYEAGVDDVLTALGLSMFVEDWTLDLGKDLG
jgi:hypothetical protein